MKGWREWWAAVRAPKGRFWLVFNCALYAGAFWMGLTGNLQEDSPPAPVAPPWPDMPSDVIPSAPPVGAGVAFGVAMIMMFVFWTFGMLLVISVGSFGSGKYAGPPWTKPDHSSNPYSRSPLPMMHGFGYMCLSLAVGLFARGIFFHDFPSAIFYGTFVVAIAVATLVGLWIGMAWCKHKFAPLPPSDATPQTPAPPARG
jgi:hypothetical protein